MTHYLGLVIVDEKLADTAEEAADEANVALWPFQPILDDTPRHLPVSFDYGGVASGRYDDLFGGPIAIRWRDYLDNFMGVRPWCALIAPDEWIVGWDAMMNRMKTYIGNPWVVIADLHDFQFAERTAP